MRTQVRWSGNGHHGRCKWGGDSESTEAKRLELFNKNKEHFKSQNSFENWNPAIL